VFVSARLLFEETQRTLFCSDLFHHVGDVEPLTSADVVGRSHQALKEYQAGILAAYVPYTPLTTQNLKKLAVLKPKTPAIIDRLAILPTGQGRSPSQFARFLSENNLQFRSVTEAEEATLLRYCSPSLQDLVVFAINTGFRLREILKLKWEEVDLDHGTVRTLVRKTQQMIDLPLNDEAARVVRGWHGIRKGEYVFYNPETDGQWKDLWLGLKKACRKAGLDDRGIPSGIRSRRG